MPIRFDEKSKILHLFNEKTSYVMQILDAGYLAHRYYGKRVRNYELINPSKIEETNLDVIPQEFSAFGTGDFRTPTFEIVLENGSSTSELKYVKHEVIPGKSKMSSLPATYVNSDDEAETLEVTLCDDIIGLTLILSYTIYSNYNVITRNVKFLNNNSNGEKINIQKALSFSIDFEHSNFDLLQLSGAWCREKHIYKRALVPGIQSIDSKKGISSHQQNPFVALLAKNVDEDYGEVYGFNLVYSGNFLAEVEVDQFSNTRVQMGINPFDFNWELNAGEVFETPEVVMVYTDLGLGDMSRTYHKLYRDRLCRGKYQFEERPILINNWEATYFDFTADKIEEIATAGKELRMELFVLDDGWFGKRDSDNCSLGDWVVDKRKLPDGLDTLVNKITDKGIRFGLWFEPEMVSPDSDLYRAHPDWCIHVPNREPKQSRAQRTQLVLDLSREDVCNEIIRMLSDILESAPISYVKWDMNRGISDLGSAMLPSNKQREISHRYILGLYYILETITSKFPEVLFESCASGGGRFDPGMLYYMPQTWTSDDTDAIERLKIQYGTSLVYPASSMGSHISACPNHQVGRTTSLETRGNVAMSGNFGYELDLTKFTDEEKEIVKAQVAHYKEIRHIIQYGEFYRILSPFEGSETSWIYVTEDKTEAVVFYFKSLEVPNMFPKKIRLKGLNSNYIYAVEGTDIVAGGDELMYSGIDTAGISGDFSSKLWTLKAIK
ncbi:MULTISPECIES: alpha-galactosidase [unclassified Clostridium]|uniref:alpha-galactosidase n=1 Tax=unclassified Clostridium TaxID=2614128 RepID=UPI00029823D7|nr:MULTISPECIES: alpha-galactosidase [unclassified Clostridium]EKQ56485.1 MAG: alpha-galactosidase [Clostridium sp. Maddingley MBC34-26]